MVAMAKTLDNETNPAPMLQSFSYNLGKTIVLIPTGMANVIIATMTSSWFVCNNLKTIATQAGMSNSLKKTAT